MIEMHSHIAEQMEELCSSALTDILEEPDGLYSRKLVVNVNLADRGTIPVSTYLYAVRDGERVAFLTTSKRPEKLYLVNVWRDLRQALRDTYYDIVRITPDMRHIIGFGE